MFQNSHRSTDKNIFDAELDYYVYHSDFIFITSLCDAHSECSRHVPLNASLTQNYVPSREFNVNATEGGMQRLCVAPTSSKSSNEHFVAGFPPTRSSIIAWLGEKNLRYRKRSEKEASTFVLKSHLLYMGNTCNLWNHM